MDVFTFKIVCVDILEENSVDPGQMPRFVAS